MCVSKCEYEREEGSSVSWSERDTKKIGNRKSQAEIYELILRQRFFKTEKRGANEGADLYKTIQRPS